MKYSICIPVYNVEKYIEECLESVVNQNYDDYEVIIIDDGSIDKSHEICRCYVEKCNRVRLIRQENQGLMMARKAAVLNAIGKYLVFVDSDDYIEKNLLETIDKYIEADGLPDILMYGFYRLFVNGIHKDLLPINDKHIVVNQREMVRYFLSSYRFNNVCGKVIKREILYDHIDEIYTRANVSEDALQTAHILKYSKSISLLNIPMYYYRQRKSSIIHTVTPQIIIDTIDVQKKVKSIVEEYINEEDLKYIEYLDANTLNNFMDQIFKMNNSSMPSSDKKEGMRQLFCMENMEQYFVLINQVKIYNRFRYMVIKAGRLQLLLMIDVFFRKLQLLADKKNGKMRFD